MKKQLLFLSLLVFVFYACKNKDATPDPAGFLAGEYVSDDYRGGQSAPIPFPINGQSVTMKITRVAANTVQVDIRAAANGEYSPGRDLTFPKAYIESRPADKGKSTYNVYFTPRTSGDLTDALQFYKSDNSLADYYYVPAGGNPAITRTLRFKRK